MATCFLTNLPEDVVLLISSWLQLEDLLRLVQTCKSLYTLTTIKSVWLARAMELQQRRRVHYLPLEDLDIAELRKSVFHALKLELKWSGQEDVDPSPVRSITLNPILHAGLGGHSVESQAITWVWFLEDGVHLTCVVDDTLVQLWNIASNTPILSFEVGGILIRASQYSEKDYFLLAGSIDAVRTTDDGDINPTFSLWKYKWDTVGITNGLAPATSYRLPVHPTSIFLTKTVAGAVYVTDFQEDGLSITTEDILGYFTFLIIEVKDPYRSQHRYTPLSFFGTAHAELWKKELVHCVRTSSHFVVIIESSAGVEVYSYDWHLFGGLFAPQALPGVKEPSLEVLPRLKVTYELDSTTTIESNLRHSWTQPCPLWNGHSIGMLGYYVSSTTYRPVLTLSVLDLSIIFAHNDGDTPNYHLHDVYKKWSVAHTKPGYASYTTRNNRFLGSQPRNATGTISAVERSDVPAELAGLSLAHFTPGPATKVEEEAQSTARTRSESGSDEHTPASSEQPVSEDQDQELPAPKEEVLHIDLTDWFASSDRAEDIDLDDRLGRVAFGMEDGMVIILEFV